MMKRHSAMTLLVGVLIVASGTRGFAEDSNKPGLLKQLFGTLSWEETLATVETPRAAAYAVNQHIKYKPDLFDALTEPEVAWKRGYGDCEDIAHAVVALCEKNGFEAWVEVFYSPDSFMAHAVAVGRVNGQLWISNGRFIKIKDMSEARELVASSMKWKAERVESKKWAEMDIAYNVASVSKP